MKKPKNFESGLAELQKLLDQLSSENTSLEEAVKLYAQAAELISYCNETLQNARLQVESIDTGIISDTEG